MLFYILVSFVVAVVSVFFIRRYFRKHAQSYAEDAPLVLDGVNASGKPKREAVWQPAEHLICYQLISNTTWVNSPYERPVNLAFVVNPAEEVQSVAGQLVNIVLGWEETRASLTNRLKTEFENKFYFAQVVTVRKK